MDIEAIVKKHVSLYRVKAHHSVRVAMRAALTELSETHAIELRAYEATVANLAERIRQLEAERVQEGWKPVPRIPTKRMLDNGDEAWGLGCSACEIYVAMLAAAPQPKKEN